MGHVADVEADKIATPQFAVYCQIEKGEIPEPFGKLETDPNGPDLFPFERWFLAGQLGFAPRTLVGPIV